MKLKKEFLIRFKQIFLFSLTFLRSIAQQKTLQVRHQKQWKKQSKCLNYVLGND